LGKRITGVKNVLEAGAVTDIVVAADHESTDIEADQMNVDIGHTTAGDLL
jgi:formiminotetrahydrofolate cyclodeaminase